jgi:hypothetical protein
LCLGTTVAPATGKGAETKKKGGENNEKRDSTVIQPIPGRIVGFGGFFREGRGRDPAGPLRNEVPHAKGESQMGSSGT